MVQIRLTSQVGGLPLPDADLRRRDAPDPPWGITTVGHVSYAIATDLVIHTLAARSSPVLLG